MKENKMGIFNSDSPSGRWPDRKVLIDRWLYLFCKPTYRQLNVYELYELNTLDDYLFNQPNNIIVNN